MAAAIVMPAGSAFGFGALAVGGSRTGYSYNYDSADAAGARAVQECGPGCRVVTTFQGCAAYASGRGGQSTGTGSSRGEAQSAALAQCPGCSIRVWACESGGMQQTRDECGGQSEKIKADMASADQRQARWWATLKNYSGGETASLCEEGKDLRARYQAMTPTTQAYFAKCPASSNAALQASYRTYKFIVADIGKGLRTLKCR